jgi:hypothetical protein
MEAWRYKSYTEIKTVCAQTNYESHETLQFLMHMNLMADRVAILPLT